MAARRRLASAVSTPVRSTKRPEARHYASASRARDAPPPHLAYRKNANRLQSRKTQEEPTKTRENPVRSGKNTDPTTGKDENVMATKKKSKQKQQKTWHCRIEPADRRAMGTVTFQFALLRSFSSPTIARSTTLFLLQSDQNYSFSYPREIYPFFLFHTVAKVRHSLERRKN